MLRRLFHHRLTGDLQQSLPPAARVSLSLQELVRLQGVARTIRPGRVFSRAFQAGHHLSPYKGSGMAFDEVRPYAAGDDVRNFDWKVTARTGEPHTKLFREERERPVHLLLDLRPGMFFATRGRFKSVLAAAIAALLGWHAHHGGDRVGGVVLSAAGPVAFPPRRDRRSVLRLLGEVARRLQSERPADAGSAGLGQTLLRLEPLIRPGSRLHLISDFRGLDEAMQHALHRIARHSSVNLVFVHDPLERELPPPGLYRVSDGTRAVTLDSADPALRREHQFRFRQRLEQLEELARHPGIDLLTCPTEGDPVRLLQGLAP